MGPFGVLAILGGPQGDSPNSHVRLGGLLCVFIGVPRQQLLVAYPHAAAKADGHGRLPLHWTAQEGHSEILELLLVAYPDGAARNLRSGRGTHTQVNTKDCRNLVLVINGPRPPLV